MFQQLIDGLEKTVKAPVERHMIHDTTKRTDLQEWLAGEANAKSLVLLGQPALNLYPQSARPAQPKVFVSGINAVPGKIPWPGVSLTLDPRLYIDALHALLPAIERVLVYYDRQEQAWMKQVEQAGGAKGLRIEAVGVTDAFDLARRFDGALATLDPTTTALWFGRNTVAYNSKLLYPYILERTWDRRIAVFSDTIAHVRGGFLFAYYPNYTQIGEELGALIQQSVRTQAAGFRFSQAGQLTLNARTAQHLGVVVPDALLQQAKPLFPEP